MQIEIDSNPNCDAMDLMVFNELGETRRILGILADHKGADMPHDVAGVYPDGKFGEAYATKVADSGDGDVYLIHGGPWGIRLRPKVYVEEDWDLKNQHQMGEPYKVYASEGDIQYA